MCTFHLTMERADAVRGLARSVRPVLERFELVDPVPEPWLHLTMNGLGFADEVPDDRLEAVADEVFALGRRWTTPSCGSRISSSVWRAPCSWRRGATG